jgi:MSHA pilin protein MshC
MCPEPAKISATKLDMKLQRGFTMVELIAVMVIVGIVAAVAAPKFMSADAFKSHGFRDQIISTLRYAQKAAIAQHRYVCATFTSSSVALTYGSNSSCLSGTLTGPSGPYNLTTPSGSISLTASVSPLSFDDVGRPNATDSIKVTNETAITVEAETGYVH